MQEEQRSEGEPAGRAQSVVDLGALSARHERLVIGLNSGTSVDAIDALLVAVSGHGPRLSFRILERHSRSWPPELSRRLRQAPELSARDVTLLEREAGEAFAATVTERLALWRERHASRDRPLDLIGSHGQTVCHLPPDAGHASLQVGDPDVIAERTGLAVVSHFRARDLAAGGEGAPLSPWLDALLFAQRPGSLVLNLGGIANLSLVGRTPAETLGTDCGPANLPLDLLAGLASGGAMVCDEDGALAAAGRADEELLATLVSEDEWLVRPQPKSTGRERYGAPFVERLLSQTPDHSWPDRLATATAFVARTVRMGIEALDQRASLALVHELSVAGGGVHNPSLMAALAAELPEWTVAPLRDERLGPGDREPLLFALLAHERLGGVSTSVPGATGAAGPRPLGRLSW